MRVSVHYLGQRHSPNVVRADKQASSFTEAGLAATQANDVQYEQDTHAHTAFIRVQNQWLATFSLWLIDSTWNYPLLASVMIHSFCPLTHAYIRSYTHFHMILLFDRAVLPVIL